MNCIRNALKLKKTEGSKATRQDDAYDLIKKQLRELEEIPDLHLEITVSRETVGDVTYDVYRAKAPYMPVDYWAVRPVGSDADFHLYPYGPDTHRNLTTPAMAAAFCHEMETV